MYLGAWQRTWKTEWTGTVANLIDVRKKSKNILNNENLKLKEKWHCQKSTCLINDDIIILASST
jgi:hypothetical protein